MFRRAAVQGVELSQLGYKIVIEVIGRGQPLDRVKFLTCSANGSRARVYIDYLRHLVRLRLAKLPGGPRAEHVAAESAVQPAGHEPLPCHRHRGGHRLELLPEFQVELAGS
jgi:hypothetical protein